jgi:hypothetical protein
VTTNASGGVWLLFSGNVLLVPAGVAARGESSTAARLLTMLESEDLRALDRLDRQFASAWWPFQSAIGRGEV